MSLSNVHQNTGVDHVVLSRTGIFTTETVVPINLHTWNLAGTDYSTGPNTVSNGAVVIQRAGYYTLTASGYLAGNTQNTQIIILVDDVSATVSAMVSMPGVMTLQADITLFLNVDQDCSIGDVFKWSSQCNRSLEWS